MQGSTTLTTRELAEATAGGDSYIRTKNGEIRGLALNRDYNPDAPEVIVFGSGPEVKRRAELLLKSGVAVPTYVKKGTDVWLYVGEFRARDISYDKAMVEKYGSRRRRRYAEQSFGVLFMEAVSQHKVEVTGGGYPDSATRDRIENASMQFVTNELIRRGYEVRDDHRENLGYDLLASSRSGQLLVEVKGTTCSEPRFFLTRNESQCGFKYKEWRLFLVCDALGAAPYHQEFKMSEIEERFTMDALVWECRGKQ
jgi:hypothetical protein